MTAKGDQFGVADLRLDADLGSPRRPLGRGLQQIVGAHVQCRREGVQVSVHESLLLIWVSTLILGTLHHHRHTPRRSNTLGIGHLAAFVGVGATV
jgi:hypothetical protein